MTKLTSYLPWIIFNGFIVLMLALDLLIFHRKAHKVTIKEASIWSIFWIVLALLFNLYIYYSRGFQEAIDFFTGYLIEKSLSVDNLFVFLLIFRYFHTPEQSLHKVLFYGVLGAIIFRALFIWLGIALIAKFHWIIYVFGFFLILTGIKFLFEKDKKILPDKNPVVRFFTYFFPVTKRYEGDKFFILENGKYIATLLFLVLIVIETTDIIFAVDSIPAILAITQDPFIVYTSNIFAILGLRSLFFVLSHVMSLFHYLHYGLSFILIFIGTKMLVAEIYDIPSLIALGVIFLALFVSILFSIFFPNDSKEDK